MKERCCEYRERLSGRHWNTLPYQLLEPFARELVRRVRLATDVANHPVTTTDAHTYASNWAEPPAWAKPKDSVYTARPLTKTARPQPARPFLSSAAST